MTTTHTWQHTGLLPCQATPHIRATRGVTATTALQAKSESVLMVPALETTTV